MMSTDALPLVTEPASARIDQAAIAPTADAPAAVSPGPAVQTPLAAPDASPQHTPDRPAVPPAGDPSQAASSTPQSAAADGVASHQPALVAAAEQLAQKAHLPPALRRELADLVARHGHVAADAVHLPLDALLPVLANNLPAFLRPDPDRLDVAQHPAGDVFFEGAADELTEAQAERLAREQLAASGLLRGQTVRQGT